MLVGALATRAAAQAPGTACTSPLDPACNHLKCYKINDVPIKATAPLLQLDNQFGREVVFRLKPVFLCVPMLKSCCVAGSCSPSNCQPNPVPAPALPHFKCYTIQAKTCTNANCATLGSFTKGTQVLLRDQFGPEGPLALGPPKMLCAPASKIVVGQPTTTTTTSTTSTTSTTLGCHQDPLTNQCTGPCPPTAPAGSQCALLPSGKCGCVAPPVCCECPGAACTNTNGQCPTGCNTVPNATCNAATGSCGCGLCRDPASPTACTNIPCSTSQPCPSNLICDPSHCPTPCDPCQQGAACNPVSCLRPDGTNSQCRQTQLPPISCECCGPAGGFCTSDADCCSGICNVATQTCS
jgi:hypothetical protein